MPQFTSILNRYAEDNKIFVKALMQELGELIYQSPQNKVTGMEGAE